MASTSDSPISPTEDGLRALVGTELPGGTYTLEQWWVRLVNECALAPADDGAASPVFAFLVATAAMGVTWAQLLQMCGASERDGPMAGESDTTVRRPLRTGGTYAVRGWIENARRKRGRQTGVFDLVDYRLDLTRTDEPTELGPDAVCRSSLILPRSAV